MNSPGPDYLQDSVIVAAHPDDEVLWFSSVLKDVGEVLLCFSDVPDNPRWSAGRTASLAAYPLQRASSLNLAEAGVFWGVDWENPEHREYGLAISRSDISDSAYIANFDKLKSALREKLAGCRNVFTHNPWGEYGNAEHVQVHLAVLALREDLEFNLWIPGYFSRKTASLMSTLIGDIGGPQLTLPTNPAISRQISKHYKDNNCWTWYDDYIWPPSETFRAVSIDKKQPGQGTIWPMNYVDIDVETSIGTPSPGLLQRVKRTARRILAKSGLSRGD